MPEIEDAIIQKATDERKRKFEEYEKYVIEFDKFLQKNDLFQFLDTNKEVLNKIRSGGLWDKARYGIPLFFSNLGIMLEALWNYGIFREGFLGSIKKHINEPEMQKLLVEKTCLLDQIGENKEIVKGLVEEFALTGDDKRTRLLRGTTNATLDMLGDENSRKVLQNELVNNYYKFNINANRNQFINDYVKYEKSQIKNIGDLHHIIGRKNQRELNIAIQSLKNSVVNAESKEKSNILKTQLTNELKKLDIKEADITKLLAKHKNLKLSDAQYILQQKYAEALGKQKSTLEEVGKNPDIERIREKADSFLREEAEYKFDVQERELLNSYVKDYVRFEKEKGNTKTKEELRQEATEIYLRQAPDYMRLTENVLNVVAQQEEGRSDNLKGVLREQGKDLIEYFKDTKKEAKVRKVLSELGVKDDDLKELPEWLQDKKNLGIKETVERICTEQLEKETKNLDGVLRSTANTTMYDMMENFGIDDKLLDVAPSMLGRPQEIADIVHAIRNKPLFVWAEDLMNRVITNPELRKTFHDNPQLASNVAISMVNSIPFLKNMCDDFGCSKEVLEIIKEVIQTPEETKQILNDMNKGDYTSLVKNTLKLIAEKEPLQNYLKEKENGQAYAILVSALFRQLEPMKNMKQDYGLDDRDIEALVGIIPHILNDPAKLNVFYDKLGKEKYIDMMVAVNDWAKDNEGLKEYLKSNAQSIGAAIGKAIPHTPADAYIKSYLSEINLDIQSLVSAVLQHDHLLGSDNLSNLLQGLNTGDLPNMLASIDRIIDEPNIKATLSKALGKENMELVLKLSKIVNMEDIKEAIKIYDQDKDYYKLAAAFLGNEEFKTLLVQEKENIANFAQFLVEKVPIIRDLKNQYLGTQIKVDELIKDVVNPGIIEGIEAYVKSDRGKLATMKFAWAMSGLITKFPILDYLIPTPTQDVDLTTTVKSKIDAHNKGNETKTLSKVLTAEDNLPELKKAIQQKSLAGIKLENVNFNAIDVDGFDFSNAKFVGVAFQKIKDTSFINATFEKTVRFQGAKISNTNFAGATFRNSEKILGFKNATLENVNFDDIKVHFGAKDGKLDFSGATIDAYTLESLAKAVNKNPDLKTRLNFNNAKIKGDLSQKDLSNLPLKGADLSAVTSMNGTILNGTDLENAIIDKTLLIGSIGLHNANFIDQETIDAQKENRQVVIANKMANAIVAKLVYDRKLVIAEDKAYSSYVNELAEKLKNETKTLGSGMVNHIYDLLEANYAKLNDFEDKQFKHYSDLASSTQGIPKLLLNNSYVSNELTNENLGNILKYEMMKNLIADAVGKELFGEGYNRGKDFMLIREHLSTVLGQLNPEEKQNLYQNLIEQTGTSIQLKQPDSQELVSTLKDKYYAQTKYTKMGAVTGGIYLPENSLDKLVDSDLADMKSVFNKEQQQINDLAKKLGEKGAEKLFGTNMSTARQADTKKIVALFQYEILPNIMPGLTQQKKQELLNTNVDTLIGNYGKGYWGKRENHSLSQILYDSTSYTKMGYASGGVQVDDTKLHSKHCKDAMISCIKGHLEPSKSKGLH